VILKSMARKTPTFGQLAGYMDRKADPRYAHFWNLDVPYGASREEVVRGFELNDLLLRSRSNGNRLYHEILSLKRAEGLSVERQKDILHDLAAKWLAERAPGQLGYARMHVERDHVHYHIMLSAGERGRDRPVRLPRAEFARMQKDLEAYAMQRFPQLGVERRYGKTPAERTRRPRQREDAMRRRTGGGSDRERAAGVLREAFARARNGRELADALAACGFSVHQRGDSVSFGHAGRRYRLRTLGLEADYRRLVERLSAEKTKGGRMGGIGKTVEKVGEALGDEPRKFAREAANLGDAVLFGADRYKSLDREDRERATREREKAAAERDERQREKAAAEREEQERAQALDGLDRLRAERDAAKKRDRGRGLERGDRTR
jgi:hypothetical protein